MENLQKDNQAFVNQLADYVCRLGLQVPVLVGLEAGRPFAFLGGQLLWVAKPVLSLFVTGNAVNDLAGAHVAMPATGSTRAEQTHIDAAALDPVVGSDYIFCNILL